MLVMATGCDSLINGAIGQVVKSAETPSVSVTGERNFALHYGEDATLKVSASVSDGGSLSYQWYKGSSNDSSKAKIISDATKADYKVVAGNEESETYYFCKVTNSKLTFTAEQWSYSFYVKVSNIINVDSSITVSTTWNADYTYFVDYDTWVYATLTIPAGIVVKFGEDAYLGACDQGSINAVGTEDKPIIFTSARDTSVGISVPGRKNATPIAGDWEGLGTETNGSTFENCIIQYAGSSYNGALYLNAKTTVKNCTFRNNSSGEAGYVRPALNITIDAIKSTVKDNVFYNNDYPLTCTAGFTVDPSNVFHKDDMKNGSQLIALWEDDIRAPATWSITEVPYCYLDTGANVEVYSALTIEDGVIVKFAVNMSVDVYKDEGGVLIVKDAILTSLRDDEHGGDSNGDGTATTPEEADWDGVWYSGEDTSGYWNDINRGCFKEHKLFFETAFFCTSGNTIKIILY